ncbi:MAG: geranylgeranylglycerol-phosphate geranylgeranyltransferase [Flavobacteriales bacterium]
MRDLIRLTRPLNLLIVALTMIIMRYGVVGGWLNAVVGEVSLVMSGLQFFLLTLSTVLIMAGGNVINDYFDTRIDRVNKPHGVIVGRSVKRRVAMAGHWVLSGAGLLIGVFVAAHTRQGWLALIPPFAVGALWFYSTDLKKRLLIGNGLVATLSAMVVLQVGLYDVRMMEFRFSGTAGLAFGPLWWWILSYAAFAFVSTLMRELQKDMADVRGDAAAGCRTVPIVRGMRGARFLVAFWAMLIIVAVGLLTDRVFVDLASRLYLYALVILPILASCILTWNARTRDQHNRAGDVMKLAMVFAVAFGAIHPWLLA